jgi:hypothetical protein
MTTAIINNLMRLLKTLIVSLACYNLLGWNFADWLIKRLGASHD